MRTTPLLLTLAALAACDSSTAGGVSGAAGADAAAADAAGADAGPTASTDAAADAAAGGADGADGAATGRGDGGGSDDAASDGAGGGGPDDAASDGAGGGADAAPSDGAAGSDTCPAGDCVPDDLSPLSDEFDDPSTLGAWSRVYEAEQWGADQLEEYGIGIREPGKLTMVPHTVTWFGDWRGPLAYKEVTGDFVVTAHVDVSNRAGDAAPAASYSLAGLLVRTPRDITPDTWTTGGENYVFLSLGAADEPGTFQSEVKTTVSSASSLETEPAGPAGAVRVARIGETFVLLLNLDGAWAIHRRFPRADMPDTLQVGMCSYTDFDHAYLLAPKDHNGATITADVVPGASPDLVAHFDYVRFRRPTLPAELLGKDLADPDAVTDTQLLGFLGD